MILTRGTKTLVLTEFDLNGTAVLSPFTKQMTELIFSLPGTIYTINNHSTYSINNMLFLPGGEETTELINEFVGRKNTPITFLENGYSDLSEIEDKINLNSNEQHKVFHIKGAKRGIVGIFPKSIEAKYITDGLRFFPVLTRYSDGNTVLSLYCKIASVSDFKWSNFKSIIKTFLNALNCAIASNNEKIKKDFDLVNRPWNENPVKLPEPELEKIAIITNYSRNSSNQLVKESKNKLAVQKKIVTDSKASLKNNNDSLANYETLVVKLETRDIPSLEEQIKTMKGRVKQLKNDEIPYVRDTIIRCHKRVVEEESKLTKFEEQIELVTSRFPNILLENLPKNNPVLNSLLESWSIETVSFADSGGNTIRNITDEKLGEVYVYQITLCTQRPTIFKANNQQYLAGPFRIRITTDRSSGRCEMGLALKNYNSFYGHGNGYYYRTFPHTREMSFPRDLLSFADVCLGAAQPGLYKAMINGSVVDIFYTLDTLFSEVDINDTWGKSYVSFTKFTPEVMQDWEERVGLKTKGTSVQTRQYCVFIYEAFAIHTLIAPNLVSIRSTDRLGETINSIGPDMTYMPSQTQEEIDEAFLAWRDMTPPAPEIIVVDEPVVNAEAYTRLAPDNVTPTTFEEPGYTPVASLINNPCQEIADTTLQTDERIPF